MRTASTGASVPRRCAPRWQPPSSDPPAPRSPPLVFRTLALVHRRGIGRHRRDVRGVLARPVAALPVRLWPITEPACSAAACERASKTLDVLAKGFSAFRIEVCGMCIHPGNRALAVFDREFGVAARLADPPRHRPQSDRASAGRCAPTCPEPPPPPPGSAHGATCAHKPLRTSSISAPVPAPSDASKPSMARMPSKTGQIIWYMHRTYPVLPTHHPHPSLTTTLSHCIICLLQEKPVTLHQPQCTENQNYKLHTTCRDTIMWGAM